MKQIIELIVYVQRENDSSPDFNLAISLTPVFEICSNLAFRKTFFPVEWNMVSELYTIKSIHLLASVKTTPKYDFTST